MLRSQLPEIACQPDLKSSRDILKRLREIYCGEIGFEFDHIDDDEELKWLHGKVENQAFRILGKADKRIILDRLAWSTKFEVSI